METFAPPPSVILLADDRDLAAAWAAEGLRRLGVRASMITLSALLGAPSWEQRVTAAGGRSRVELRDGPALSSEVSSCVVNRLSEVRLSDRGVKASDQEYVSEEWQAVLISFLHGFGGVMWDRPQPPALSGRVRGEAEWAWLARNAGFRTGRFEDSVAGVLLGDTAAPAEHPFLLFVLGDTVWPPVTPDLADSARRLASAAGIRLLGIQLDASGGTPSFVSATSTPDFRIGGRPLLVALAGALGAASAKGGEA